MYQHETEYYHARRIRFEPARAVVIARNKRHKRRLAAKCHRSRRRPLLRVDRASRPERALLPSPLPAPILPLHLHLHLHLHLPLPLPLSLPFPLPLLLRRRRRAALRDLQRPPPPPRRRRRHPRRDRPRQRRPRDAQRVQRVVGEHRRGGAVDGVRDDVRGAAAAARRAGVHARARAAAVL
eukprot:30920-Pelagococcus_subviridis.AAC.30